MKAAPAPTKAQGATKETHPKSTPHAVFTGTGNPRHLRVIAALLTRARPREEIDRIAGAANGPDLVADLRERGLSIPCARTPCYDRDGFEVKRGIYWLNDTDRRKLARWQRERD